MEKITLFTTHKFDLNNCPPNLKNNLLNWKNLNKTFDFKYFNDEELNNWMKENIKERTYNLFLKLNSGAGKADLFRICYLYYHGGIWFDADLPAFDILYQKNNFLECLNENQAILVRNRKCNNPRYTFIASYFKNNKLFEELIHLINKHIEFVLKKNKRIITIHVTGPFVLHKLLNIKYNFNNITELKINKKYNFGDSHFIYINDIIPEKAGYVEENTYKGYQQDLIYMKVKPHNTINCVKN